MTEFHVSIWKIFDPHYFDLDLQRSYQKKLNNFANQKAKKKAWNQFENQIRSAGWTAIPPETTVVLG